MPRSLSRDVRSVLPPIASPPGGTGAELQRCWKRQGHAEDMLSSLGEKGGLEWEAQRCSVSRSTVSWGRPKRLPSPIEAGGAVRGSWFSHLPKA